jgi:hypothetical protein
MVDEWLSHSGGPSNPSRRRACITQFREGTYRLGENPLPSIVFPLSRTLRPADSQSTRSWTNLARPRAFHDCARHKILESAERSAVAASGAGPTLRHATKRSGLTSTAPRALIWRW